jgi:SP family sugar:H+ symporter-like MFS transporter
VPSLPPGPQNSVYLSRFYKLISPDDGTLIAGLQALPAWQTDLNYPAGARLGFLNAAGSVSGFIVGPIIAYIDENYGRKWGIRCMCHPEGLMQVLIVGPVYGITMVVGSVIGCVAGVAGSNGYACK